MIDLRKNGPLLSHDELECLSLWRAPPAWAQVDRGFSVRILLLMVMAVGYVAKLVFFTEAAAGTDGVGERAWLGVLAIGLYLFSYLQNWYFDKVAVGFFSFALAALLLNYAPLARALGDSPWPVAVGHVALGLVAGYCLLLNAIRADRLPPKARRLWR